VVEDEIGIVVLDSNLLEIYNGQDAATPVPEADEESIGAFTVANMNDTDNDEIIDNVDDDVRAANRGRDEVDLMRLVVRKPSTDLGGAVELSIEGMAVHLWEKPTKGQRIQLTGRGLQLPTSSLPRTIWIEAPNHSSTIRDIMITAKYRCASDSVAATAVWADLINDLHDTVPAVELGSMPDWVNITNPPEQEVFGRGGTGLNRILGVTGIHNGILFKFRVLPNGIVQFSSSGPLARGIVQFDVGRQAEARAWFFKDGQETEIIRKGPLSSLKAEESNDDLPSTEEPAIDESPEPVGNGDFFSYDAPGFMSVIATEDEKFLQGNFLEYIRVSFNGIRPEGSGVLGSRCSEEVDWHVRHTLINRDGLWARSTGDTSETSENEVGPGHRPVQGVSDDGSSQL
jgi:hypothetical protein